MHTPNPAQRISLTLDGANLSPRSLWTVARTALEPEATWAIGFSPEALERMDASAKAVTDMARSGQPAYGVNTGFGHFAEHRVPVHQLQRLQGNLIRSHACGVGEEVSRDIVLAMWLLRLNTLSRGYSGIRSETLGFFLRLLEAGILGCVPSRGSVGASGDLIPSAHAVLPILGEGFCTRPAGGVGFERVSAAGVLAELDLQPMALGPKEGLALINGTQYTTALATKAWYETVRLLEVANLAAAMSMEAMGGTLSVLDGAVLETHHPETGAAGHAMAGWLEGGRHALDAAAELRFLQAPYCLRCAPQVHGAVLLAVESAEATLAAELDAVSDNPLIFSTADGGEAHSCGNFHGIYPARVSDSLATALTILGSISERRTNMAMDDRLSGLPCFLTKEGGLNSGLMMAQVAAASLVSECRSLCWPASVDSIPTNCDREDQVPMGPIAGLKALRIVERVGDILAIELLAAAQALDLRGDTVMPPRLKRVHGRIREKVPFLAEDRILAPDLAAIRQMIETGALIRCNGA